MARRDWALLALAASLLSAGCCHCAAPYDYCQPTFLAQPDECCQPNARMNSVFDPMQVASHDGPPGPDGAVPTDAEEVPPGQPSGGSYESRPQPRSSSRPRPPSAPTYEGPLNGPHAEMQSHATKAIPVSQEANRRPPQLRR